MKAHAHLLLVEDDATLAASLVKVLADEGHAIDHASAGDDGLRLAREKPYDLVLTDLRLPGMGGLELVDRLRAMRPRLPVILITAHGTADTAIEATKRGAYDYLLKPFPMPDLIASVARALDQTRYYRDAAAPPASEDDRTLLVGRSRAMQEVYKEIGRVAPQDITVLIRGETGTGKEMVARAIWRHSRREGKTFLAINCAAIPETLLESELFGHERGAFTGAETRRIGRFEQADGGTLFLDEIGDVSLATQVRLLRVLQDRTIQRVGGRELIPINVRIVAATHRNLEDAIARGQFREDLFYRLSVVRIRLPTLRDRPEDIPLLAAHFAEAHARVLGLGAARLRPEALERLARHTWPGNVRELENVVRRALLAARGFDVSATLIEEALADALLASAPAAAGGNGAATLAALVERALREAARADAGDAHARVVEAAEAELLRQAMQLAGGNQSRVARWLGLSRLTLREKLQRHGLRPARENTDEADA